MIGNLLIAANPALTPGPFLFRPTAEQLRFMWLHERHLVVLWRWHFSSCALRAYSDNGQTATIWRDSLDELVREGLMVRGGDEAGRYDMKLTDKGRETCSR